MENGKDLSHDDPELDRVRFVDRRDACTICGSVVRLDRCRSSGVLLGLSRLRFAHSHNWIGDSNSFLGDLRSDGPIGGRDRRNRLLERQFVVFGWAEGSMSDRTTGVHPALRDA